MLNYTNLIFAVVLVASAQAQTPAPAPRARSASNVVITTHGSGSYLGVAVVEIDADRAKALKLKEERGVEIKVVDENSPASKAGLKEGDVLLEYNGQRIEGIAQFIRMVSETPVGRKATLQLVRNGSSMTLPVTIEARSGRGGFSLPNLTTIAPMPPMPPMPSIETPWSTPRLGIETESISGQLAEYFGVRDGVLIRHVVKGSAAEKGGLKAGDVVVKVNGDMVHNAADISAKIVPAKTSSISIVRNHKEMSLEVTIAADRRSEAIVDGACYTA